MQYAVGLAVADRAQDDGIGLQASGHVFSLLVTVTRLTILCEVMKRVIVYTADPCARCGQAKALLTRNGIAFSEVNLSKDPDGRAKLSACTGLMPVPQSVIGEDTLGGLDDLERAEGQGRLPGLGAAGYPT